MASLVAALLPVACGGGPAAADAFRVIELGVSSPQLPRSACAQLPSLPHEHPFAALASLCEQARSEMGLHSALCAFANLSEQEASGGALLSRLQQLRVRLAAAHDSGELAEVRKQAPTLTLVPTLTLTLTLRQP